MIATDQSYIIAFLSRPEAYGETAQVEIIETHISKVFLLPGRVFKLKRAVTYPYLDFSTPQLRKRYCEAEVDVNRRTAPDLYKGIVAVTRNDDGELALGGDGEAIDWLVEMARFDEAGLFDRMAIEGRLEETHIAELADVIAGFHQQAEACPDMDVLAGLQTTIIGNAETFAEFGPGLLDMAAVDELTQMQTTVLASLSVILQDRRENGFVKSCHGDLHLRNICLWDGHPTLFDGIEFNDTFSRIDVLYDLAFLLMDLEHRSLGGYANIVLNRYLDATGDDTGLACLGLYLSLRAAIRAHIAATLGQGGDAQSYLALARKYLKPSPPRLIAVGGLSGSGKSRLARVLGPHIGMAPGARVIRSDITRKRLAGVTSLTRLGDEGYTPEMTERTFEAVYQQTRIALAAGQSVIADTVFAKPEQRHAIAAVADEMGVPFDGLWLEAAPEIMQARVTKRTNNPSDADADVLKLQMGYHLGDMDWTVVDSSGSREKTLSDALDVLDVLNQARFKPTSDEGG